MTNRVAVVTGASRGIGRACAERLAKDGYDVVVNYLSARDAAASVADAVRAQGRQAMCIQADVSQPADVDRLITAVAQQWERVDVLVANAGISFVRPVEQITSEEWDHVMAVNLKGTFLCAQRVIPMMKRQREGHIVMIASQAGLTGGIFIGLHYAAAKAGVICLAKSLAKQLASFGVRVNCVAPGIVNTEMVDAYPKDKLEELVNAVPMGRIGYPEDVAAAVGFLCTREAHYMTGTTLHVNGGIYMP
jgi:3-oxoacyl-[acyl-carrier protein] reductase